MNHEAIGKAIDQLLESRGALIDSIFPKEVQQHFRVAKKEALLGIKDLLQHAIDNLEDESTEDEQQGHSTNRTIKITE